MTEGDKDILLDIRDRTVRLETKLDSLDEIKSEMKELHKVSDGANEKANQNTIEINRISGQLTWLWRTVGTTLIGIAIAALFWAAKQL